jgi:1-deoxy-D-xylulose-5-phosphate reductoisomerase
VGKLSFAAPDEETFPLLRAAKAALAAGGAAPAALNAANEVAVGAFLARKISMLQLFDIVLGTVGDMPHASSAHTLSEIIDVDREARERAAARL